MSGRTVVILFVVLLVVGAIALLISRQEETAEPTPTLPPQPESVQLLEGVEMNTVGRLEVRDEMGDRLIELLREPDGGWFQVHPTATLAISQTVNTSVTGLLNLTSRRTLSPDENPLSAYGLDAPTYRITLAVRMEAGGTVRHVFLVGDETPAGDAYYVQKEGDPRVYLVPKFSLDNLAALLDDPPIPTPAPPISVTVPFSSTVPLSSTTPITSTSPITP